MLLGFFIYLIWSKVFIFVNAKAAGYNALSFREMNVYVIEINWDKVLEMDAL